MKYTLSILILYLFFCVTAFSQQVLENNPPAVKFYKINTPHFKVLYAKGFEEEAQRMANTLEHIYEPEARTMLARPGRISVVLQNQSSVSNGFVSLIPRRSEFYTMPPQDYNFLGTNDWLDQLATHEYRHVVQFQRANSGFNRLLYYAFGPATLAAMATSSVPQWVWEGDAVATETAFTHSGRGRIPNFGLLFRTNLQEGRVFNYNKQYLRSYKHNINDHYVLGYHMIGYLRKKTNDPDVWGKVMQRTANASFLPFRFSGSVKKIGGLTLPELYKVTAADLQQTWAEEQKNLQLTTFESNHQRNTKAYTDYQYPQALSNGDVVALKSGIGDIARYVILRNGKEIKSFTPGLLNDAGMLSVSGSKIVWAEYEFDPRWQVKNYSVIKSYNVDTKEYKVLTHKTRYAGAAVSPDGSKIATVESKTDYKISLIVIDGERGGVIRNFENPENAFYSMPRWTSDGKKIVVLKTLNKKRSVVTIDFETREERKLIEDSYENIGHPVLVGNYLLFNSPITGIDNIYAYDLERKVRLQVTSGKYGAYNPAVSADGKTIYYNNQSRDGLDVVSIPFDPRAWKEFTLSDEPKKYDDYLSEQEGRPGLLDSIPGETFQSSRYSKISGIFNLYSWGPYVNSSLTQVDIGISSRDVLSTTLINAGYRFDINERTGAWHAGVSYQGWFPIIDVDVTYANRSVNEGTLGLLAIDTAQVSPELQLDSTQFTRQLKFKWKELTTRVGIRIPLLTTKSKYHSNVTIGNYVGVTRVSNFENSIAGSNREISYVYRSGLSTPLRATYELYYPFNDYQDNGTLISNQFTFSAYRLLKQSRRDIYSKFGQAIYLNFYSTPYGGDFTGNQFSVYTQLYFPGLFKHHSLWGYWGYQKSKVYEADVYLFNNQIPLPRGISVSRFEKFYSMSGNYTLPLWYPDVAIGPLLNVQRFRGNIFYDYGFGSSPTREAKQTYASVGGELRMDFNVMRYLPQLNIGFRYSYALQPVTVTEFEFLIGLVNF